MSVHLQDTGWWGDSSGELAEREHFGTIVSERSSVPVLKINPIIISTPPPPLPLMGALYTQLSVSVISVPLSLWEVKSAQFEEIN